jgi:hypothetical protein
LKNLPEEIGNLSSLNKLNLRHSDITSLPTYIGKLQNLKEIDLSRTGKLKNLPEEIGNLSNLNKFELCFSKIRSLPTSIGKLQNLKEIDLSGTSQLENLPEEFGNLSSLNKLNLRSSKIRSLPTSMYRLHNLRAVCPPENTGNDILKILVENLPLLGSFGPRTVHSFGYTLACNRAKSRMRLGDTMLTLISWPFVLQYARQLFSSNGRAEPFFREDSDSWQEDFEIPNPDAIFHLIFLGRESFIRLIANCTQKKCQNGFTKHAKKK